MITDSRSNGSAGLISPQPLVSPARPVRPVRPRWAAVVIAVVVVLAASIGVVLGAFLIGPRGGAAAPAAGYVPGNATMYYEMRLDLPGDQRANLEQLLGHFSGVDINTVLGDGLDTALDDAFNSSNSGYTYTKDLKPWLNGQLAVALVGYPSMSGDTPQPPTALLLVGARNAAAATQFLGRVRADINTSSGVTATSEDYAGTTIWTWANTDMALGQKVTISAAVVEDQLIVGVGANVIHTALDVHAGRAQSLADRSDFRDGLARLPVDRVVTYAVDIHAIGDAVSKELASASPGIAAAYQALTNNDVSFAIGSAHFEGNRVVADAATTYTSGTQAPGAATDLAAHAPGDALVYLAGADVGTTLAKFADAVKSAVASTPNAAPLQQVETALGTDLKSFVSWIGDAAFVASWDGSEPSMGLVITPKDPHQASVRLLQLQGLVQLSGAGGGPQVSITEAQHGSAKITTLKFAVSGATDVPAWATTVQYAVTDDRVVIGLGEKFVARVLDTTQQDSLAGQQRFRDAASAAGGSTDEAVLWLDLAKVRDAVVGALPSDVAAEYNTVAAKWVNPFDYAISVVHASGSIQTNRTVIAVK